MKIAKQYYGGKSYGFGWKWLYLWVNDYRKSSFIKWGLVLHLIIWEFHFSTSNPKFLYLK